MIAILVITFLLNTTKYGYFNMIITQKTSPVTGETNTMAIDATIAQVEAWQGGMLIQKAMPSATAEQREFLISGCTSACWDQLGGDE